MIGSFHDAETRKVWIGKASRKLPSQIQVVARRKLRMLNAARGISDLRNPPNNRLEKLRGDRMGQWSIRVNAQWRIVFRWQGAAAREVQIVDYH